MKQKIKSMMKCLVRSWKEGAEIRYGRYHNCF